MPREQVSAAGDGCGSHAQACIENEFGHHYDEHGHYRQAQSPHEAFDRGVVLDAPVDAVHGEYQEWWNGDSDER